MVGIGLMVSGLVLAWIAFNYEGDYLTFWIGRFIGIGLIFWGIRTLTVGYLAPRNGQE
jgi:hypothetical protein